MDKIIKACYSILKLDNRASKKEVEIAYDVLMNKIESTSEQTQNYRFAFEYLMQHVYCNFTPQNNKEDNETFFYDVLSTMPDKVEECIEELEEEGTLDDEPLTDKLKAMWASMHINMPLLFREINKNCIRIFGHQFWTEKHMKKIIEKSCLNPFQYECLIFTIQVDETFTSMPLEHTSSIYSYIKSLKILYGDDKLCSLFKVGKKRYCIYGKVIAEVNIIKQIAETLNDKFPQNGNIISLYMTKG